MTLCARGERGMKGQKNKLFSCGVLVKIVYFFMAAFLAAISFWNSAKSLGAALLGGM